MAQKYKTRIMFKHLPFYSEKINLTKKEEKFY